MVEQVDTQDLKSCGYCSRTGSIPVPGTRRGGCAPCEVACVRVMQQGQMETSTERASANDQDIQEAPPRGLKVYKAIFPVLIGLAVVVYLFLREVNPEALRGGSWREGAVFWLLLALLLMACRDLGYIWRLRILAEGRLGFWPAFRAIMLWEFTSAVTPSAVGGTSVAILFVHKEGLSVGRSSAVVMATSFLDEFYFLIMFPLLVVLVGSDVLFGFHGEPVSWTNGLLWLAIVGYAIKFAYVCVLSYGFFVNPRGLKWLLMKLFRIRFLRRWKYGANQAGTEIITASREFRAKPFRFWLKAFVATFVSWTARYWVANALMLAFFLVHGHFVIFARQLVMWIMMLVMPTPGGSGFAEYIFTRFLSDYINVPVASVGTVAIVLAFLWRLATYYPYLLIGVFILPKWLRKHFNVSKKKDQPAAQA